MIKCVVVGTGQRGVNSYVKPITCGALSSVAKIVGLYDKVKKRAELCSSEYGNIEVFDSFERMLKETKPDYVIVTTVDSTHHDYIIRALESGFDVISEKPMTTSRKNALRIMEAEKKSGHRVRVTFNMRYMKPFADFKRVISSGVIGEILHADFSWRLDRDHGADYFRRWHRYIENTNSLLIHKATHHFDVISWIMGNKKPRSVFARCFLDVYGKRGEFRGECCHRCPHTEKCDFYFDVSKKDFNRKYYLELEAESGYCRDGCVFDNDIDIFDRMTLNISYKDGATMNYSLVAYSPDEGFQIDLIGTKGRAEFSIFYSGPHKGDPYLIKITDLNGSETVIETRSQTGEHGGADNNLLNDIFLGTSDSQLGQSADSFAGYLSLAVGDMAVMSNRLKREVFIDEI